MLDLNQVESPWWVRSRDTLFVLTFVGLLGAVLGLVPSPTNKAIERIEKQHQGMLGQLKVSCYHEARWIKDEFERDKARLECMNGELYLQPKALQ